MRPDDEWNAGGGRERVPLLLAAIAACWLAIMMTMTLLAGRLPPPMI